MCVCVCVCVGDCQEYTNIRQAQSAVPFRYVAIAALFIRTLGLSPVLTREYIVTNRLLQRYKSNVSCQR